MKAPMRIYLQINPSSFARFLWFRNNALNEMLMGVYGISKKQATLDFIFPERNVSEDELKSLNFTYSDLIEVKEEVDHITCHSDM